MIYWQHDALCCLGLAKGAPVTLIRIHIWNIDVQHTNHPAHTLFGLLPLAKRYRCISTAQRMSG